MTELTDDEIEHTYGKGYFGPGWEDRSSKERRIKGFQEIDRAAVRRVLDELTTLAEEIHAEEKTGGYPLDWMLMWETLTDHIDKKREGLE